MNKATLGGVYGAGEVHSRRVSEDHREYRGAFAFRAQDTPAIVRIFDSATVVQYEGPIDGEHRRLQVVVTDISFDRGIAYFAGGGEPYVMNPDIASGQ